MKSLSPKDASILAVIADNSGMSQEDMLELVSIADDADEVKSVARWLLEGAEATGTAVPSQAQASARALRGWALENRQFSLRERAAH